MRGKYTQVPADTFRKLPLNAGILAKGFNPAAGTVSAILGATSGGLVFEATHEFKDFGEDVDNLPKNTKEMKQINDVTAHVSGTFLTIDPNVAKSLMAAADIDNNDATHIIPRMNLTDEDFDDVWLICDYSDENTGASAGYVAIHLMNALNIGGFKLTTADKEKGKMAFDYQAHFTMADPDMIPYEVYIKAGGTTNPSIELNTHSLTIAKDAEATLKATVIPATATVTWTTSDNTKVSVDGGVVTGEAAGSAIIKAAITVDGVTYDDTCTVICEA